jgi:hypothetical protein
MSDNVVKLGQAAVDSPRRTLFLQTVAAAFEEFVAAYGREPDAIVYVLNGIKQPSQVGWCIEGESGEGVTSTLALAACHLQAEAASTRQGF